MNRPTCGIHCCNETQSRDPENPAPAETRADDRSATGRSDQEPPRSFLLTFAGPVGFYVWALRIYSRSLPIPHPFPRRCRQCWWRPCELRPLCRSMANAHPSTPPVTFTRWRLAHHAAMVSIRSLTTAQAPRDIFAHPFPTCPSLGCRRKLTARCE